MKTNHTLKKTSQTPSNCQVFLRRDKCFSEETLEGKRFFRHEGLNARPGGYRSADRRYIWPVPFHHFLLLRHPTDPTRSRPRLSQPRCILWSDLSEQGTLQAISVDIIGGGDGKANGSPKANGAAPRDNVGDGDVQYVNFNGHGGRAGGVVALRKGERVAAVEIEGDSSVTTTG